LRPFLILTFMTVTAVSLLAQAPAAGASNLSAPATGGFRRPPTPTGPAPKLPDGTPDFSGLWMGGGSNSGDISKGLKTGETLVMTAAAEKIFKSRLSKDDPEALCLPFGIPRSAPYPWRLVQTPARYFILFEGNIHSYRQIFMDGRKHPADPDPSWYGHSIGRWEGNTLVVDTVGFNDKFWFDYLGHPHSEQLHTIERFTRTDLGNMAIEVTIEDPVSYEKPFTTVGRARLQPATDELLEYICQENNQDVDHISGPARLP